ncbi:hypothetical protein RD792_016525 [Penstemon davidsonii]|uniref:Alkyl transferase n=1 Tax=Penstemon davidsonii TaxID=160366 RepID=A0ABR0CJU2_9LAMI|nr:hypothetical protein RD792_016525 [Penstemon davidsonii]
MGSNGPIIACFSGLASLLKLRLAATSNADGGKYPGGLKRELMPKHVAIIMDGNRRWAKNRGLPVQLGHKAGEEVMKRIAIKCSQLGVKVLTVFAFSTENWLRPQEEVGFLMKLFEQVIQTDFNELTRHDMQISIIGDKSRLPKSLQSLITTAEESSKSNKGMRLFVALNYSGRYDITQATKKIASKVRDGILSAQDIDEGSFDQHLETSQIDFPNPDLLIRTSGELRLSNFMLWQLAYTELLFVQKLFPEFNEGDLLEAFRSFQQRQRRYGGV